jgi:hypothetical protein
MIFESGMLCIRGQQQKSFNNAGSSLSEGATRRTKNAPQFRVVMDEARIEVVAYRTLK